MVLPNCRDWGCHYSSSFNRVCGQYLIHLLNAVCLVTFFRLFMLHTAARPYTHMYTPTYEHKMRELEN